MKRLSLQTILPLLGAVVIAAAVAAGLYEIYRPTPDRNLLRFHDAIVRIADTGRLARCAWIVAGDVQSSAREAITMLDSRSKEANETGCRWYESFDEFVGYEVEWRRLDQTSVRLCYTLTPSPRPDSYRGEPIDFTFPVLNETHLSEGHRCFDIDVTTAPRRTRHGTAPAANQ